MCFLRDAELDSAQGDKLVRTQAQSGSDKLKNAVPARVLC
jgi:hypothetical protein